MPAPNAVLDLAHLRRSSGWNRDALLPVVPPGSAIESSALDAIDLARDNEIARLQDTPTRRAKRHRRYWRARGLHVDV